VPSSNAVFDWLVIWAAEVLTGAQIGADGMTSYRRLRGRAWSHQIAPTASSTRYAPCDGYWKDNGGPPSASWRSRGFRRITLEQAEKGYPRLRRRRGRPQRSPSSRVGECAGFTSGRRTWHVMDTRAIARGAMAIALGE
jgi:hypothetical protein